MIFFRKPKLLEYGKIAELVNISDEIYHSLFSEKEYEEREYGNESIESLKNGEKNREYLCVYDLEGRIMGYASFRLKNSTTFWISMFAIHPYFQKRGIGSQFLQKIEKIALEKKACVVVLETEKNAVWAVNFYKKNGYKVLSDWDLENPPYDNVLEKKQVEERFIFGKITAGFELF